MIPHDILGPDQDYVVVYRNQYRRKVHTSIFQTPAHGPDGKTVWGMDMATWWKFLDLLRIKGLVKQPSVRVIRGMISQRETLYTDKIKRGPRNSTQEAVERYEREMAGLRAQLEELNRELEKSIAEYGDEVSPASTLLDDLIDQELQQATAVDAATRSVRGPGRAPGAPQASRPQGLPGREARPQPRGCRRGRRRVSAGFQFTTIRAVELVEARAEVVDFAVEDLWRSNLAAWERACAEAARLGRPAPQKPRLAFDLAHCRAESKRIA
jgi:hypothetical protein